MAQISRILFPVDFSDSCVGAARYVEAFAGQFQAEVMLLHTVGMGEHTLAEELLPARKEQLDRFLEDELKYFTTHRICTIADEPSDVIIEKARTWQADLVMLSTHGLGFFKRHLIGSVTASALHNLECPVWTSVHAEAAPPLEAIHCRRILCSVDLTENGARVLSWSAWLAKQYGACLGIVHATAGIGSESMLAAMPSVGLEEEFDGRVSAEARKQIGEMQKEAGTSAQVYVNPGKAEEVIAQTAREFEADLLIIGRHQSSGIAGAMHQKAYAILRESPCPVISV